MPTVSCNKNGDILLQKQPNFEIRPLLVQGVNCVLPIPKKHFRKSKNYSHYRCLFLIIFNANLPVAITANNEVMVLKKQTLKKCSN